MDFGNTFPPGTYTKPAPKTQTQSRYLLTSDRVKAVVKGKMQEYLESFFKPDGENRELLGFINTRWFNYNIDRSFDPKTDPTQRKLQIARYFNELRAIIPAIIIMDGGVTPIHQSMGMIADSSIQAMNWFGYYPIVRKVPISILLAARDIESIDDMCDLLAIILNEFRIEAGGTYMSGILDEGQHWAMMLPNDAISFGSVSDTEIPGDPIEKIFYSETTFEVFFEGVLTIRRKLPELKYGGMLVETPGSVLSTVLPVIVLPSTININQQYNLLIQNFQDRYRIIVSDPNVASLTYNMKLTPRKHGQFTISIFDPASNSVITTSTITVV